MPQGPPLLVTFTPPEGWTTGDDAPPDVGSGGWITLDAWRTWHARVGNDAAALACFGAPLHTWTEEATAIAFEHLDATASGTLARLGAAGASHVTHESSGNVAEHSLAGAEGAAARTFIGFVTTETTPRLEACFVGCTTAAPTCLDAVARTLPSDAVVAPPQPDAAVRAVVLGIHHSRTVAVGAISAFVLAGALLVWRRPRGRRK